MPTTPAPILSLSQLALARQQLAHMATLLAESEQSVERLAEQSKVLKTEIRRLETNAVREQEGTNLEYVDYGTF